MPASKRTVKPKDICAIVILPRLSYSVVLLNTVAHATGGDPHAKKLKRLGMVLVIFIFAKMRAVAVILVALPVLRKLFAGKASEPASITAGSVVEERPVELG